MSDRRVPTGITGLDEMLFGGFLEGSTVLVRGAPGTGKTALALQYLVHGATQHNEQGLLISFEQFAQSLHRDARSLGWDLESLQKEGKLHLLFTSPEVLLSSLETPTSSLSQLLLEKDIRRVAVDSVSHFRRLTGDAQVLRKRYNTLVNALRREGVTAVLTSEESRAHPAREERGRLSYMIDVIILLRYVEIDSAIQRCIVVLKMRGSDHVKEIRRYEIDRGGIQVIGVFEGREAILTGTPYRVRSGITKE
ncbi:MAG: AAA family ATPase [Anaerolineae bacterium]|nr:MAG: AAA family ATPase [Anaerolineae bacterium]